MTQETIIDGFRRTVESELRVNKEAISAFANSLGENPTYALTWSAGIFAAAARFELLAYIKSVLATNPDSTPPEIVAALRNRLATDVVRAVQNPPRSTSVQSNLIEQERVAAKASMVERLDRLVERFEAGEK
jgi:hypothetical protein